VKIGGAQNKKGEKGTMSKEKIIGRLERSAERCRITAEIVEQLPDGLPWDKMSGEPGGIHFNLPYDMGMLKEVRRMLGGDWGPSTEKDNVLYDDSNGAMYRYYRHNEHKWLRLYIGLYPQKYGSKCRIEQVDEITKPVFRTVCE